MHQNCNSGLAQIGLSGTGPGVYVAFSVTFSDIRMLGLVQEIPLIIAIGAVALLTDPLQCLAFLFCVVPVAVGFFIETVAILTSP